jgi:hypothetical protein
VSGGRLIGPRKRWKIQEEKCGTQEIRKKHPKIANFIMLFRAYS